MNKQVSRVYEGSLKAEGLNIGIVCSRFNDFFVTRLLEGAVNTIIRHGGTSDNLTVVWVPGAYELPLVADQLITMEKVDAIIALGVVIQGATNHAHFINSNVSNRLGEISLKSRIPVIFGLVTTEKIEQAMERCGSKEGNRGAKAAATAIEMANLMKDLKG